MTQQMIRGNDALPNHEDIRDLLIDLVDHLDALVAYWDVNQVCVFVNQAYRDWFGKGRSDLIGTTMRELLGALYEKNLPYIEGALAGEKQVFEREIPGADGGVRHSLASYIPHIVDGRVRGIFVHVADVEPLKKLERELKKAKEKAEAMATHDFLTGLPNRVLLRDRLSQALAAAKRTEDVLAVMTVDIDNFKRVNDTHGHGEGDRFLVEVASRLRQSAREYDTVARFGGDEFILLVSRTTPAEVEDFAVRVLRAVRQPFNVGESIVLPALSVGIALYPQHGQTPDALVASSDRALYAAKKSGRDRFEIAQ